MTIKFNTKIYKGKAKIYTAIPKAPRISRLWVWNESSFEYQVPVHGNLYYAAKYGTGLNGERKRIYGSFATLEDARVWQTQSPTVQSVSLIALPGQETIPFDRGPLFRDILNEWKRRRFQMIAYSTQVLSRKTLQPFWLKLLYIIILTNELS